jgi:hypothetical protein
MFLKDGWTDTERKVTKLFGLSGLRDQRKAELWKLHEWEEYCLLSCVAIKYDKIIIVSEVRTASNFRASYYFEQARNQRKPRVENWYEYNIRSLSDYYVC